MFLKCRYAIDLAVRNLLNCIGTLLGSLLDMFKFVCKLLGKLLGTFQNYRYAIY